MEIKLVTRPLQTSNTDLEEMEYVEYVVEDSNLNKLVPNWCVRTSRYRDSEGGFLQWKEKLKAIEEKQGEIVVYLYDVKALHQEIVTGPKETDREFDICYYIRWDYKLK